MCTSYSQKYADSEELANSATPTADTDILGPTPMQSQTLTADGPVLLKSCATLKVTPSRDAIFPTSTFHNTSTLVGLHWSMASEVIVK